MPRDVVDRPPHRRPEDGPPLRFEPFPYEQAKWPHPGEEDRGSVVRLFVLMDRHFPPELRDGDGFRHPSAEQIGAAIDASETDLQVALEQYLTGLAPGRVWSRKRMREMYDAFMERSLTMDEFASIASYAIDEHGV